MSFIIMYYQKLNDIDNSIKKTKISEKNKEHIRKSSISPILKFIYLYLN